MLAKIREKLRHLTKQKGLIVGLSISLVVIFVMVFLIYYMIYPYFSHQVEIIDKPITGTTDKPIDSTNDIELPSDPNDTSDSTVKQENDKIYRQKKKEDEIVNIILCGMDARHYEDRSRSDTIILASYNRTKHTVKLVSFMRDSWVHLPERGWSRINAATAYGGIGLLVNTLNENFNLDIQDYIQIKFDDFKIVIDAIGGIDVELTGQEINYINNKLHVEDHDYKNDITAEPGVIHLNGAQALWHCRNRTIGNSDYERTERQREVLTIIINQLLQSNAGQLTKLVYDLRNHVNTNLSLEEIFSIGSDALIYKTLTIETSRVPYDGEYWSANKSGASVLELDIEGNTELLHEFLGYSTNKPGKDLSEQDIIE